MADAYVRIPAEARDRLSELAAAEGLRAYLAHLADTLLSQPSAPRPPEPRCTPGTGTTPPTKSRQPQTSSLTGGLPRRSPGDRRPTHRP